MAKKTVNDRLKEALASASEQVQALDRALFEHQAAVALLLKRAGGEVTVTPEEIKAAVSAKVSATPSGAGVVWRVSDGDTESAVSVQVSEEPVNG